MFIPWQVFNAMAAIYANGGFECSIQLRLIGQVTFRHGNPVEVVQRACDQPWYYSNLPACSTVAHACNLPAGADVPAGQASHSPSSPAIEPAGQS